MEQNTKYMTVKDKITKAFRDLRKSGYFARQNFWCCQSCAWSAVPEHKQERAVFYHRQDTQDLIKRDEVYLAWVGDGNEIKNILESNGLEVEWNGATSQRILVKQGKQ